MNPPPVHSPDSKKRSDFSILLVEDEPVTRHFLRQIIGINFPLPKVLTAENGQAGLGLYQESNVGLVLTDICMPVMDGIEMARQMRILNPDVKIIALSAHSGLDEQAGDLDKIFTSILPKPITSKQLCDVIGECIERCESVNQRGE